MFHRARVFFSTIAVSLFLVACTDQPNEETSSEDVSAETTEVQADNKSETTETENVEATSTNEEEESESNEIVNESDIEENSSETEKDSDVELLESIDQAAVDEFIVTTGLDIEDYTFSFETTDQFVEITVYEKQEDDQAHTPLSGIYRYMLDSKEILVQDYLTGAFVSYEEVE